MEIITKDNYTKYYPMFVADGTEFAEKYNYDLSNLYSYLETGVNYGNVSEDVKTILEKINNLDIVKQIREVRIDMNMDEYCEVKITTKLGKDLKKGDVSNAYRISKNGYPVFFTIAEFYLAPNENTYMKGADVGHIQFEKDDYYVVAEIINNNPVGGSK